jgi:tetratricopeptide (TPR) repeat protein
MSKDYEELISCCNMMLTRTPTDYLPFYYRGLGNEELKLFDLAITDFKTSEELLRTNSRKALFREYFTRIPIQLSRVYRKKQEIDKALVYADKAVQADNKGIDGLIWRASLKEDFQDFVGSSEDLNEALRRKPTNKALRRMRDGLTYKIIEQGKEMFSH